MDSDRYLLSYGKAGEFGVFRSASSRRYRRGEQVVMTSRRGMELGYVMRDAGEGHAQLLGGTFSGQIVRLAASEDLEAFSRLQPHAEALYQKGRRLAVALQLPLEIFDSEVLLDGRNAVLYILRSRECDTGPLMDAVSERERLLVSICDLGPAPTMGESDDILEFGACGGGSCGQGGCGSCASGSCSSCKSHVRNKIGGPSPVKAPTTVLSITGRSGVFAVERIPLA
jgi:hypothetical protein